MDVFLDLVWVNGRYRVQGPQFQRFLSQNCARVTNFVTIFRVFWAVAERPVRDISVLTA